MYRDSGRGTMVGSDMKQRFESSSVEMSSLGSCLIDREALNTTFENLEVEDFKSPNHRKIFQTIRKLVEANVAVDIVTLTEELQKKGHLSGIGGIAYLTSLANSVPTVANIEHYNSIIRKHSNQDKILTILNDLKIEKVSVPEALELISEVPVVEIKEETLKTLLKNTLLQSSKGVAHRFKIPSLNHYLGGVDKGEIVTIGGFTSQGKTSLAIQLAMDFIDVDERKKILYLTSEMTPEETSRRILANLMPKNLIEFRKGLFELEEKEALNSIAEIVGEHWNLNIKKIANIEDIKRYLRRYKPDILFVDYLQNLSGKSGKTDYEIVTGNIRDLQAITLAMEITTFCLSQFSRDKTIIRRPKITDLRGSGRIEECSNIVLLIYWETRMKLKNEMRKGGEEPEKLEVQIAKNRSGTIGKLILNFEPEYCRIREPAYERTDYNE